MRVKQRIPVLAAALLLATFAGSPGAVAAPLDATVPALPASPVTMTLAEGASAIYKVSVTAGESIALRLAPAADSPASLDFDLYLYSPSATESVRGAALGKSTQPAAGPVDAITYQSPSGGTYYVEVFAFDGTGSSVLTWSILPEPLLPVYRFYNSRTGTHFYTPDEAERANVQNTLGATYTYEGPAYYTKATRNTQNLYRFYNRRSGTHFYTASESEREWVASALASTFTFEGPTYKVSLTPEGGKVPVYRFFNRGNGSHFYTASEVEMNAVRATLGSTYTFEGPAFYLGQ